MNKKENISSFKRAAFEWLAIGGIVAMLYFAGLHTQVAGTLQRAVLWTGLYDADHTKTSITENAFLTERDLDSTFISPDGKSVSLESFKGNVLFINVWASWCPPCIAEMPAISQLYGDLQDSDNISFLLISVDEQSDKATAFMKDNEYPMPCYFPESSLPGSLRSGVLPTTYVISKDGKIVFQKEGLANYNNMEFKNWLVQLADQ